MLGIVIGITSVILLMSIGNSAQQLILSQVQGIGSNLVFVIPGATKGSKFSSPSSAQGIVIKTLVENDVTALQREQSITKVAAEVRGQARVVYEDTDTSVSYSGVSQDFFAIRNYEAAKGSLFTDNDVDSFNRVAVLGPKIAETLFGQRNPIGKLIRIKDMSFRVVAVLEAKGVGAFGIDQDNLILLPLTVAQKQLLGIDYYNVITAQANDSYNIEFATSRMTSVLRQNHHITNPDKDDFTIRTQADAVDLLGSITSVMTAFLTSIAFISLVVGGIGIMNIMLVSVIERTKEIGLRKAVGASNHDILQQFLWEAMMLTFLGGIVGIALGAGFAGLAWLVLAKGLGMDWTFSLPLSAVVLAVCVSGFTGLVFGIYPARQAAKKSPIEALRYE
jgi:putative ABC transport system permease protein